MPLKVDTTAREELATHHAREAFVFVAFSNQCRCSSCHMLHIGADAGLGIGGFHPAGGFSPCLIGTPPICGLAGV